MSKRAWNKLEKEHRLVLKSGHVVIIGWSEVQWQWCARIYHPNWDKSAELWDSTIHLVGDTPKKVLGKVRITVMEEINPDIKKVRERVSGDDGVLTYKKLQEMQTRMKQVMSGAVGSSPWYVNSKTAEKIKSLGGNQPKYIVIDELEDHAAIAMASVPPSWALTPMNKLKFKDKKTDK